MQPKYTTEQITDAKRCARLCEIAQAVVVRQGRSDKVALDDGRGKILPDTAAHVLHIPTLDGPRDVVIPGHWFCDPDRYKGFIEREVEAAFAPVAASR